MYSGAHAVDIQEKTGDFFLLRKMDELRAGCGRFHEGVMLAAKAKMAMTLSFGCEKAL